MRCAKEPFMKAYKDVPSNWHLGCLSYSERLKILGLPTLEYRRIRALVQTYTVFYGIDTVLPEKFFITTNDDRTRGHKFKIYISNIAKQI